MKEIIFVTGNQRKIEEATAVLVKYDTKVTTKPLDINEIQHSDPRQISEAKAREAYKKLEKPIVINDSFWEIPALGGFPGGYMKEVNSWLSAQDFLNLMRYKKDRRIILHETVVYCDKNKLKVFEWEREGSFIDEIRGPEDTFQSVVVMNDNPGETISESSQKRDKSLKSIDPNNFRHWQMFGEWFTSNN